MSFRLEDEAPYLTFVVDRPQSLNAVDFEVMEGLEDALERVERDARYRVFVITGAGSKSFISGGDLRKFASLDTREAVGMMALRMRVILERFEALDAWTIAAVNGAAYGGGCETALACDFRFAADHATFGFTQANFAVPPGWGGLTRLVEAVGKPRALRWLAESSVLTARQALDDGLVHDIVPGRDLYAAIRSFIGKMVRHDRSVSVFAPS